jgi:hypothetical protein
LYCFNARRFSLLPPFAIALDDLRGRLATLYFGARRSLTKSLFRFAGFGNFEALLAGCAFILRTNFPQIVRFQICSPNVRNLAVRFGANAFRFGFCTRSFFFDAFSELLRGRLCARRFTERTTRAFDMRLTRARQRIEAVFLARHANGTLPLFSSVRG